MNIDLCTLDDVKLILGLSTSVSDMDDFIEDIITSKTVSITNYIGFKQILSADYTEYYDGNGSDLLFPYNIPLNTVTEINICSDWVWGSDTTVGSTDYRIVNNSYIILKDTVFTTGSQNVKLIYNAGYDTIPYDLKMVCIQECSRLYNEKESIGIVTRTDSKGGVTRVEKGFMKQSIEVMDNYRRLVVY